MEKKYSLKKVEHLHRNNIYNLVVYDFDTDLNYHLFFKASALRDAEAPEYILDNKDLFIYNIKRHKSRHGYDYSEFRESNIPENLNNIEFYDLICSNCGSFLVYVPEDFKTENMCMNAVNNDPMAIRYVPEKFLSRALIISSISKNGICLQYIPINLRNIELCEIALNNNPLALRYVPLELITLDMCNEAVKKDMKSINYVPEELLLIVYNESIIGLNRRIPFNKKEKNYRDYDVFRKKLDNLASVTNISLGEVIPKQNGDTNLSEMQFNLALASLQSGLDTILEYQKMIALHEKEIREKIEKLKKLK